VSLPQGTQLGHYQLLARIGAGGMGEVYRAHDPKLNRDVAIKVLPPGFAEDGGRLRRFEQEARALAALNHPNIVTVYEVGTHEGMPYLVMELLIGETLRSRIDSAPMPVHRVVEVGLALAQALAAAHEKGILHRDLKPENLFLTRDGRVKILDFGLAKTHAPAAGALPGSLTTETSGPGQEHTEAGVILGTTGYMSPEQVRGEALDGRSDLFALGLVLWEMASGRGPFHRPTRLETLNAILREEPPPLDPALRIPPAVERILHHCLAKDPADRFHSAHDLAFDLQAIRGLDSEARPPSPAKPSRAGVRRLVLPLGIALGCMMLGTVLSWRFFRSAPERVSASRTPSLVVLPTKVLGATESAFLSDAIPDTLSTLLGNVAGLETKLPPSLQEVARFHGAMEKVGLAYKVQYLVLSTVATETGNLALNVKLAEASTQKVLWAGHFQGTRSSYDELIRQAADRVAQALKLGSGALAEQPGSSELELALGEGKHLTNQFAMLGRGEDFEHGAAALNRALELDPAEPRAPARMADLWRVRFLRSHEARDLDTCERWARRAIQVGPESADAWLSMLWVEADRGHLEASILDTFKYLSLRPGDPNAYGMLGTLTEIPGSAAISIQSYRHAEQLGPLRSLVASNYGQALCNAGQPGEGLDVLNRALVLDPGYLPSRLYRARALLDLGRLEEAERALEECRTVAEQDISIFQNFWRSVHVALVLARGDARGARNLARACVTPLLKGPCDPYSPSMAVPILVPRLLRLGMDDEALQLMQRAIALGNGLDLDWFYQCPEVQNLRGDPRYPKILEATRGQCAILVKYFEAAKTRGELPSYLDQPLAEFRELVERPIDRAKAHRSGGPGYRAD